MAEEIITLSQTELNRISVIRSIICLRSTFKAALDDLAFAAFASIICLATVLGENRSGLCWASIFALMTRPKYSTALTHRHPW